VAHADGSDFGIGVLDALALQAGGDFQYIVERVVVRYPVEPLDGLARRRDFRLQADQRCS
jgi:hypothetical protein